MKNAKAFITVQLKDLAVNPGSEAWKMTMDWAVEAADIMNQTDLKKGIEDFLDTLPDHLFEPL